MAGTKIPILQKRFNEQIARDKSTLKLSSIDQQNFLMKKRPRRF